MKTTIKDIARAAGVSASTVSRALHDNERISLEVRQRVKQVAREMDFHPNQMARSLVSRETRIVGIVFPDKVSENLGNPFYPAVLQGLGHAATAQRYHMLLATGSEEQSGMEAGVHLAQSGYISGLVVLSSQNKHVQYPDVPVVMIGHPTRQETLFSVDNDNVQAGCAATLHLLKQGHRRIAFAGYDKRFIFTADRRKGYEQALGQSGIAIRKEWILPGDTAQSLSNAEALRALFLSPEAPTAVVCTDDAIAIALCASLRDIGLHIPQDVSLVGFNDTDVGRWHLPPLTSVDVNPYLLGVNAMKLLIDVITKRVTRPTAIDVPFVLKVRESVRTIVSESL